MERRHSCSLRIRTLTVSSDRRLPSSQAARRSRSKRSSAAANSSGEALRAVSSAISFLLAYRRRHFARRTSCFRFS